MPIRCCDSRSPMILHDQRLGSRPAAKPRQNIFADQRLDLEKKKCAGKNRQRVNEHGADCVHRRPQKPASFSGRTAC